MIAESADSGGVWRAAVRDGASAAWPICLGYIAIGLAFGAIARKTGLSPLEIGLMSLVVFAGSAQFIATAMLAGGAGAVSIVLATFSINLRHLLMSSSLSLYLRELQGFWSSVFAYGITDESFALNMNHFRKGNWGWRRALVVNQVTNVTWIASTVAGGIAGQFIPVGAFGLDYALTAMFICLLVFQLRSSLHLFVALTADILAVGISLAAPGHAGVIIASFLAACAGLSLKRINHRRAHGKEKT
jgi:4-azaleucine resistance transporter AzlC